MSVSVLILTLNEEANLARCLDAVSWSDDVVVLDSFSTDRTVAIARQRGARVLQRPFDDFAGQRNWGLENGGFKHDWVLHLDADEVVPPEMHEEILRVIAEGRVAAFRTSLKLMFEDRWIRHSSMFPAYQVRLGKREQLRFKMVGHGQRENLPPGEVGTLDTSLIHYSFEKGLADWFEKHNRYSTAEALQNLRDRTASGVHLPDLLSLDRGRRFRALKALSTLLPCRPIFRFLYMYLIRRGFLDGIAGLHYCLLVAIYEFMIVLKTNELRHQQPLPVEEKSRHALPDRVPEMPAMSPFSLRAETK